MKKSALAILCCIALAAVAIVSPPLALVGGAALALLWPAATLEVRADPTPRSIFETRRMGLA